jgi:hypothetical protein
MQNKVGIPRAVLRCLGIARRQLFGLRPMHVGSVLPQPVALQALRKVEASDFHLPRHAQPADLQEGRGARRCEQVIGLPGWADREGKGERASSSACRFPSDSASAASRAQQLLPGGASSLAGHLGAATQMPC